MAVGVAERWLGVDFWDILGSHSWIRPTSNAALARTGPWRYRIGIFESFARVQLWTDIDPRCALSVREAGTWRT